MEMEWHSQRFNKRVILTNHAGERIASRHISQTEMEELVEQGELLYKDTEHLWIFKALAGRTDNLICAAAIERNALIIKTVMTNWEKTS